MRLTTILRRQGRVGGCEWAERRHAPIHYGAASLHLLRVYLHELFHPFGSLGDSQHLEIQFNIPSQAKNLLERQKR